jgi:hypothetical protein
MVVSDMRCSFAPVHLGTTDPKMKGQIIVPENIFMGRA